jgi:rhamnose utilization protein RhaD (predicted bifunctional aldolase and dehydrogenase)
MSDSLQSLVELSARIGRDLDLVQAGGGNTSVKEGGTLWIKASGQWLIRAEQDDMFLPVPLTDITRHIEAADERFQEYKTRTGLSLRPSVETTMHGVLPQRVVIHVHSVRAIAWASRTEGPIRMGELLAGLRWIWIPYTHPGIPLTLRIRDAMSGQPEVLILENHGLVVAADDCGAAEALLRDVERRLGVDPRPAPQPGYEKLEAVVAGTDWCVAEDAEIHALATDLTSCEIASRGTLFPDQCVYLGPGAGVVREDERLEKAAERYRALYDFEPVFLLVAGAGVVVRKDLKRAAREVLFCLKRAVERIPAEADVTYLTTSDVGRLMNWDAEKYRLKMALWS